MVQEHVSGVRLCKLPLTREIVCGPSTAAEIKYITRRQGERKEEAKEELRLAEIYAKIRRECTEGVS